MSNVIVKNANVTEKQINGKSGPAIIRRQMACIDQGDGYEMPFSVGLGQRAPYPPGRYVIDPKSYSVNQYGDLQLNRYVDLLPAEHKPVSPSVPAK
ncbi:MAG: single-stranded DNA-binding protein [Lysobacteraceae bacterium]